MGLGDLVGKVTGMFGGGEVDLGAKMEELGIDPSEMSGMALDKAKEFLSEKGLDLSALEGMGLNVDEMIAKYTA